MTPYWRKTLYRASDVLFNIVAGFEFWPANMHEPLTISIICPPLPRPPFRTKHWDGLSVWASEMRQMWRRDPDIIRNHMCKLWEQDVS